MINQVKRNLIIFCSFLALSACSTTNRIDKESPSVALTNKQGYLSLVIDTLDPLKNLEFEYIDGGSRFYEGKAQPGISQVTLKVTEGEYCFVGFDVYNLRVDYESEGVCIYVEAGEVNYMGDLIIRNPVTQVDENYPRFVRIFNKDFPEICRNLIDPEWCK